MSRQLTDAELRVELEQIAEAELNRHLSVSTEWHPHDFVPWDRGRNFAAMGGDDWSPEQSQLSEVAKAAMVTNLLTEDSCRPTTGRRPSISPGTACGEHGWGGGRPKRRGTAS